MKARIIIVDDHKMVRGAWSFLLNRSERFTVVAECNTGEDAVRLAGELMPDIILMDINLPGINGFEAAEEIKKFAPAIKVVGVSQHNMPFYAMNMIRHGGS